MVVFSFSFLAINVHAFTKEREGETPRPWISLFVWNINSKYTMKTKHFCHKNQYLFLFANSAYSRFFSEWETIQGSKEKVLKAQKPKQAV